MALQSMVQQANQARENKITTIKTDTGEIKLSSNIVKSYLVAGGGNVSDQEVNCIMFSSKIESIHQRSTFNQIW